MNENRRGRAHIDDPKFFFREIVRCPECRQRTHPEYLRLDKEGYILGCSECLPRVSQRSHPTQKMEAASTPPKLSDSTKMAETLKSNLEPENEYGAGI